MKRKRHKWIWILIVVLVLAAAGWKVLGSSNTPSYAEITAETGSISTYYNFSGTVEVNQSATVTAPANATVSEVYVRQNAHVAKNTRLLRLDDGTILKSELAGEVTFLPVSVGSVVTSGETLAEIMDLSSMKIEFQIDEYDVEAIELGKMAKVTVDGSGETFEGAVTGINKRATQSGDLSYYTASIDLSGITLPSGTLPGMQVTVDILNQQANQVVLLPMYAVSFTLDNQPYVLMQDGKTTKEVKLEVGINDGNYVEITSGLQSGDIILFTLTSTTTYPMMMGASRYAQ